MIQLSQSPSLHPILLQQTSAYRHQHIDTSIQTSEYKHQHIDISIYTPAYRHQNIDTSIQTLLVYKTLACRLHQIDNSVINDTPKQTQAYGLQHVDTIIQTPSNRRQNIKHLDIDTSIQTLANRHQHIDISLQTSAYRLKLICISVQIQLHRHAYRPQHVDISIQTLSYIYIYRYNMKEKIQRLLSCTGRFMFEQSSATDKSFYNILYCGTV